MKIGVDIGGTTIGIGIVEKGVVKAKTINPSFRKDSTLDETISYLKNLIDVFLGKTVSGIGIGVPSVVDISSGIVHSSQNIPSWTEVRLKDELERHYNIPVSVNNDANCFALGAYNTYFGDSPKEDDILVGVTVGTGLGTGIVCGGKLLNGHNAGAGELCCIPYRDSTIEDYCGSRFFARAGTTCNETMSLAMSGNRAAKGLLHDFGRHIGYLMILILYAYDPGKIVIGGSVAHAYPLFRESMEEYVSRNFLYKDSLKKLDINIQTDENTSIIGAASL